MRGGLRWDTRHSSFRTNERYVILGIAGATHEVGQSRIRFLLEYALAHGNKASAEAKSLSREYLSRAERDVGGLPGPAVRGV